MKPIVSLDCCVTLKMRLKVVIVWFVRVQLCCACWCNREIVITLMQLGVDGWTVVLRWFNNTLIVRSQCRREWVRRNRIKEPCVGSDPLWLTVIYRGAIGSRTWSILAYGGCISCSTVPHRDQLGALHSAYTVLHSDAICSMFVGVWSSTWCYVLVSLRTGARSSVATPCMALEILKTSGPASRKVVEVRWAPCFGFLTRWGKCNFSSSQFCIKRW